jgi:hypothetical protein
MGLNPEIREQMNGFYMRERIGEVPARRELTSRKG